MNLNGSIITLGLVLIFICLAAVTAPAMLQEFVVLFLNLAGWLARVALVVLSVGALLAFGYGAWRGSELILSMRASRYKLEHESAIMPILADAGQQIIVHERNGTYRNLSLDARYVIVPDDTRLPDVSEIQAWAIWNSMHATRRGQVSAYEAKMIAAPQSVNLLEHLRRVRRCLIVGSSNAGKTTLLKHIVTDRARASRVLVLDPHAAPDTWPCEIIGRGSNHVQIERALDSLLAMMVQRYREIGEGTIQEGQHERVTLVIDEWLSIVGECRNASRVVVRLICEARKANLDIFVGSHSERVTSLGLAGKGDLKDGLEIVRLSYNQWTGQREATIQVGQETIPAVLPGEFEGNGHWQVSGSILPEPELNEEDALILSMHAGGASLREISQAVWGQFGTFYNRRIQEILEKFSEK